MIHRPVRFAHAEVGRPAVVVRRLVRQEHGHPCAAVDDDRAGVTVGLASDGCRPGRGPARREKEELIPLSAAASPGSAQKRQLGSIIHARQDEQDPCQKRRLWGGRIACALSSCQRLASTPHRTPSAGGWGPRGSRHGRAESPPAYHHPVSRNNAAQRTEASTTIFQEGCLTCP